MSDDDCDDDLDDHMFLCNAKARIIIIIMMLCMILLIINFIFVECRNSDFSAQSIFVCLTYGEYSITDQPIVPPVDLSFMDYVRQVYNYKKSDIMKLYYSSPRYSSAIEMLM